MYGGNQNVYWVIKSGGMLYIDDGKLLLGMFEKIFNNIKIVLLNCYIIVLVVYVLLVDVME